MRAFFTALLIFGAVGCQTDQIADDGQKEFVEWARNNATPISTVGSPGEPLGLDLLDQMVGEARLVGLGDSRHDAKEQFQLKVEFIKHLVSEQGFNVVAIEEGLPHAEKINRYLLHGSGDIKELMNRMGAWFIWDTEEFFVLVEWLRQHNLGVPVERRVKFAGIDVTDPLPGIEIVLAYFQLVDSAYSGFLADEVEREIYRVDMWQQIMQNYASADTIKLNQYGDLYESIRTRLRARRAQYTEASSVAAYDWVCMNVETLVAAHELFRRISVGDMAGAGVIRERGMADNLLWHMASSGEDSRAVVWAHNLHVGKGVFDLSIPNQALLTGLVPMGKILADTLGEDFVSLGMSFYDSDYPEGKVAPMEPESIDGALAEVQSDSYLLDLRSAPGAGPVGKWMSSTHGMRGQGNDALLILKDSFDAVVFVRQISPVTPSPRALDRGRSMR